MLSFGILTYSRQDPPASPEPRVCGWSGYEIGSNPDHMATWTYMLLISNRGCRKSSKIEELDIIETRIELKSKETRQNRTPNRTRIEKNSTESNTESNAESNETRSNRTKSNRTESKSNPNSWIEIEPNRTESNRNRTESNWIESKSNCNRTESKRTYAYTSKFLVTQYTS